MNQTQRIYDDSPYKSSDGDSEIKRGYIDRRRHIHRAGNVFFRELHHVYLQPWHIHERQQAHQHNRNRASYLERRGNRKNEQNDCLNHKHEEQRSQRIFVGCPPSDSITDGNSDAVHKQNQADDIGMIACL